MAENPRKKNEDLEKSTSETATATTETTQKLNGTVKLGSKGEHVKVVQKVLGTEVTGKFGHNDRAAVKEKQKAANLLDTGVVDQETWKAISS